jgi:hypothetical protein
MSKWMCVFMTATLRGHACAISPILAHYADSVRWRTERQPGLAHALRMHGMTPTFPEQAGRGGRLERRQYLIDRFPVSFQGGTSWHCGCREFNLTDSCRHTREAAGMRDAQTRILERAHGRSSTLTREQPRHR